jgi:hypothetical protein
MHVLGGLLLLVVAVGAIFLIYATGVFQPIIGPLGQSLNFGNSSSTQSNQSAYYQEVTVQFVSLGSQTEPMTVRLEANFSGQQEGIILSGWSLRTNEGTYRIPRAVNLYSPSVEGVPPEDIYLRDGGVISFYSDRNPQSDQGQAIRSGLNEWRIWLGEDFLEVPHGRILLRDREGKEVDQYEY